ncbi:MAG: cytochrome P450 [Planctomycetes bacterium]|nr:cytochrome P450 [Planctomycetota bacterium]
MSAPPGPAPWPFAALRAYRRDPLGYLEAAAAEHGGLVHFRMAHRHVYLLNHPDPVEHVLVRQAQRYRKGITYAQLRRVIGQGLLGAEGELWRAQRRLSQPFFGRRSLAQTVGGMALEAEAAVARLRAAGAAGPVELYEAMAETTLRVVGRCLLGVDAEPIVQSLRGCMQHLVPFALQQLTALVPPPPWLPTPTNRRFKRALATLDGIVNTLIEAPRVAAADAPPTLLEALLEARDDPAAATMTSRQVRDELVSNLLAGHETTASALSWTLFELARRPELTAEVRAEVARVAGDAPLTAERVAELDLTRRVIQESLRLNPPTWVYTRHTVEADQIGAHTLRADAIVLLCQWTTHRNPAVWPDPLRFDPARFLPEQVAARPTFSYFPFGGGQHQCIGRDFALLELTVLVAELVRRLELTLVDEAAVQPFPGISLTPRDGIWARVAPRAGD